MPNARTATIATPSMKIGGCWAAREISQADGAEQPDSAGERADSGQHGDAQPGPGRPRVGEHAHCRVGAQPPRTRARREPVAGCASALTPVPRPARPPRAARRGRAAAGGQDDDPLGRTDRGGPVRDQQHRPARRKPLDRGQDGRLALRVQPRRRFVQQQQRGVAQEGAGEGDALPLARRTVPSPCSPSLVARPSGRSATNVAASAWRSAAHTSASVASGAPSRTLSATVPLNRYGRWGTQAMWRRHCSTSRAASSVSPTRIVPDVGDEKAQQQGQDRALPGSAGTHEGDPLPRREHQIEPVEHRPVAPGPDHGDRVQAGWSAARRSGTGTWPKGAGTGVSSTSKTRSAAVTPSIEAWNCAPTARTGR